MGKRKISGKENQIPDYDRRRLENMAINAQRVKAAGLANLISKSLQEKVNRVAHPGENSSNVSIEDKSGAQLKPKKRLKEDQQAKSQKDHGVDIHQANGAAHMSDIGPKEKIQYQGALPNRECSRTKGSKQSLIQAPSATNVLKAKTQKNQSIKPAAKSQQDQVMHQLTKKPICVGNAEKQLPKACSNNFITPGSLGAYRNMRRMQANRQVNVSVELDDFDLEEMCNEQHVQGNDISCFEEDASDNQDEDTDQEIVDKNANTVAAVEKKKHRGRSILAHLHKRIAKNHQPIVLNDKNQPVGPSRAVVTDFIHFLGTVAKDPKLTPLNCASWKDVPNKDKIWDYVTKRFDVPVEGREYVLKTINDNWKLNKHRLKKATYEAYDTMEEMLANRPKHVPENQFIYLLELWNSAAAQEISKKNSMSAKCNLDYHTMGPCSYAMKRDLLKQKHPDGKSPSQAEVYIESRKRVPGRSYKTDHMTPLQNIEKMKEIQSMPDRDGNGDPYYEVITKEEHSGRLRLHGRTVTKTKLKEKECKAPFVLPQKYMDSIEEYLGKKIFSKIISQLQEVNPGISLNIPNFTTTNDVVQTHESSENEDHGEEIGSEDNN